MALLRSLSGRLLVLTVLFVMLGEVLIFVPSVARYRLDYLEERLVRADLASLNVMAQEEGGVSAELARQLLAGAEVLNIVVRMEGRRQLVLAAPDIPEVVATHDLREVGTLELIADAHLALFAPAEGVIRVIGVPRGAADRALEITIEVAPMTAALRDYGWRILKLSLVISLITGGLVFLAIRRFVVRPMEGLIENIMAFSDDPENAATEMRPRSRVGEVARAERALQGMQKQVRKALKHKARLAALGEAVAKVSHDLRNILASTQLLADRLERSADPLVARIAPKLLHSLDRAIRLCQSSLDFGKADEAPPVIRQVVLAELVEEVTEGLGLGADTLPVRATTDVPAGMTVPADPEQLYRVLANLVRNAAEAIAASGRPGQIRVSARGNGEAAWIRVLDDGPGMPASAMEHLFQPFRGGSRRGGSGLGLAIAHELVHAHGGTLALTSSTTAGTEFVITLPLRRLAA